MKKTQIMILGLITMTISSTMSCDYPHSGRTVVKIENTKNDYECLYYTEV